MRFKKMFSEKKMENSKLVGLNSESKNILTAI